MIIGDELKIALSPGNGWIHCNPRHYPPVWLQKKTDNRRHTLLHKRLHNNLHNNSCTYVVANYFMHDQFINIANVSISESSLSAVSKRNVAINVYFQHFSRLRSTHSLHYLIFQDSGKNPFRFSAYLEKTFKASLVWHLCWICAISNGVKLA